MPDFRIVPSIELLRRRPRVAALQERYGHAAVVEALRAGTAALRQQLLAGPPAGSDPGAEAPATADEAAVMLESGLEARLQAVFQSNAWGRRSALAFMLHAYAYLAEATSVDDLKQRIRHIERQHHFRQ